MKKRRSLIGLFILLVPVIVIAQSDSVSISSIDSFTRTVQYKRDLTTLTNELTAPFTAQRDKARAIFRWITDNIAYDYKYYNKNHYQGKEPKGIRCKDDADCAAKKMEWEIKYINRILQKKRAVCHGYAMLFQKMCTLAGLRSEFVPGYTRTEYYQVGTAGSLDHAWNVVWIDSVYYTLDATWAAGGCPKDDNGKLGRFKKHYNDYYWLTPAADFARNHYPQTAKWTLLTNYTKDSFATNHYYESRVLPRLTLLAPHSGIVNAKKGDTVHFKIDYRGSVQYLQINSNIFRNPDIWTYEETRRRKKVRKLDTFALKKQQYVIYKKSGTVYEFSYPVTDESLYYIDILFDRQRVMRFKVVMKS